jgi:hypothetical protein
LDCGDGGILYDPESAVCDIQILNLRSLFANYFVSDGGILL